MRYRGSILGLAWSFLTPLLMLGVYTFVFAVVFEARWGITESPRKSEYAMFMFVGLIVHGIFAECVNRSPTLIVSNTNYVKKMIFPLQILPVVTVCVALIHAVISVAVLLLAKMALGMMPSWHLLLLPLVVLPLVLFTLGLSWFLAAVGVFIRDIGQMTTLITAVLLFLSPVFYPVSAISGPQRILLYVNPLTYVIEQARDVVLLGRVPDWRITCIGIVIGALTAMVGYWWFQKTRKGFADVV